MTTRIVVAENTPKELRVGRAGHAFDHLGDFADQADAAAKSGATIIYATGIGGLGYSGLLPRDELEAALKRASDYSARAKQQGIELALGYLCATSIVKLDTFDKNWTDEFRSQFKTPPAQWRQQDLHGQPLKSWYGGDYEPACMNNPDWRAYQRAMVRYQLETNHDGIFFDNPTMHPQGCYCPHCMVHFAKQAQSSIPALKNIDVNDFEAIRKIAGSQPNDFRQFRATIARDFLNEIRDFARTINPHALITCNNSLNSPGVLFSQSRLYAYSIYELSKAEDFVVVEDMATQPRTEANGKTLEYGPTYQQLHAISHGKPVVAATIANADYHTAPHLTRLAMAEAAAHNASYLSWPTWPEDQRTRMIAAVRPQADFLRLNEALLNDAPIRSDAILFLPFRRWLETEHCTVSDLAATLTKANIQYRVICEDDFKSPELHGNTSVLVVESRSVFTPAEKAVADEFEQSGGYIVTADKTDWLTQVRTAIGIPSVVIDGPPTVRATVHDQPSRTIVHLYNLNIQRLSSFEDKVIPANDVAVRVRVPWSDVRRVTADTSDTDSTRGPVRFTTSRETSATQVTVALPRLAISSILVFEE
ncbi:MAG: hypothetical protein L0Z07_04640 [Planctomycetes bacterium]|nr:hypothetical protein [Planctomycetota bacterium]